MSDAPSASNPSKWKGNRREVAEDFFETPREAVDAIRPWIPAGVKTIWEPTYGKGAIGKVLEEWGYTVIKTDKFPKTDDTVGADFLTCEAPPCDMVIFNPPFSLKTEFLARVCALGKPFMFICPLTIMETRKRWTLFREHHLSVLNLPNRTNYVGAKTATDGVKKVFFHSVWVLGRVGPPDAILYA